MLWTVSKWIELNDKNPLEDFLRICENLRLGFEPRIQHTVVDYPVEGIFYRGEPEIFTEESALIPKIFRKEHLNVEEAELISDFKATFPEHKKSLSSDIDWLSFMQHQGLPTRLLDWSTDPLVALYFALGQDQYDLAEEGVVYIVPIRNRIQFLGSYESPIRLIAPYFSTIYAKFAQAGLFHEIKRIKEQSIPAEYQQGVRLDIQDDVIKGLIDSNGKKIELTNEQDYRDAIEVFPPNSHARIRAQSGVFTIHYGKYLNQQKILCDGLEHQQSHFVKNSFKIIIPNRIKQTLQKQLEVLGISEFKLFPEEDKFYNHFRKNKFRPTLRILTGKAREIKPISDPQKIRNILLNIDNYSQLPGITEVQIPYIVKHFKLLGIERVIDEIFKKFLCSFIEKPNLFIFSPLYKALEEFCKENKGNQKLVIEQLSKLEQEDELLSKIIKTFNQQDQPGWDFDLKDNLFHKAFKLIEKKQTPSEHDSVEENQENQENTETTTETN